jgi:hypothetical protein
MNIASGSCLKSVKTLVNKKNLNLGKQRFLRQSSSLLRFFSLFVSVAGCHSKQMAILTE